MNKQKKKRIKDKKASSTKHLEKERIKQGVEKKHKGKPNIKPAEDDEIGMEEG